jgi:hypothetical protein
LIEVCGAVTEVDNATVSDTGIGTAVAWFSSIKAQLIDIHTVVPDAGCVRRCSTGIY